MIIGTLSERERYGAQYPGRTVILLFLRAARFHVCRFYREPVESLKHTGAVSACVPERAAGRIVDCHCQRHKTQRGISATVSYCNTCIHGPPVGEWMPAKGPPTHSIFQQVAASPSSQGALANARRGMARCDFVRRSFYTVSPAKRNGRCLSRGRSFLGAMFRMQRLDV
ncbi:hypothetical protein CI102_9984 [Trichoderma harzianum]|uniref:Uncharacterized protein n=1 Tax=Trichoderma harzianum CBS 226.95 TaxID=983964 RepID=A0A2T4AGN5_TRIHA|nr:hypothetical protein M431DRAFT_371341 [Trichoderma harzianum CBS 226.95]PKK46729.1 hypothetical protein CI102_9984 [Trichoderma harzianum]PTB56251.1 hypothetical protein M431DRAFT_371341 [Trichoderma harzianum CBS 226.95]